MKLWDLWAKILSREYRALIPIKAGRIRRKHIINVVFVFSRVSMWKNDYLYQEMKKNNRFRVTIVIVPDLMLKCDVEEITLECETFLNSKKYEYVNPFSQASSIKCLQELKPDIIFYPRPYNSYPAGFRFEDNYASLFCHSDYGYHTIKDSYIIDTRFINHVWQSYYENENVKCETQTKWPHLKNIKVAGLPNTDSFWHNVESQWKKSNGDLRKVIWAPHFSVTPGWLNYSNFLLIAEDMLAYAKVSSKQVQFAFKPHPLLKNALYNHPDWGEARTDAYYREWDTLENTQLMEGDYIGLFVHSDAMVHDSSSFTVEYLHTNKPVMFLVKGDNELTAGMFKFGAAALDCHYKGTTMDDIKSFIEDVVIGGNDFMRSTREQFIKDYLVPPHNKTASQNIIDAILGK